MFAEITWASAESVHYKTLEQAAVSGDIEQIDPALKYIDINALYGEDNEGETLLHKSAAVGNLNVTQYLLAHGANSNALSSDRDGKVTPLWYAAREGHVDIVKALLKANADINSECFLDATLLHAPLHKKLRIGQGEIDTMKYLLDLGLDIDAYSKECGGTPIMLATQIGTINAVNLLVERGASMEGTLFMATQWHPKTTTVLNFILQHGGFNCSDRCRSNAILGAISHSNLNAIELLLAHVDEAGVDLKGRPFLGSAAGTGHVSTLRLLLDRGFDVNARNPSGYTPLFKACFADIPNVETIRLLLDHGADVSAKLPGAPPPPWDRFAGFTSLHISALRAFPERVAVLLQAGADVKIRDAKGKTTLIMFASLLSGIPRDEGNNRIQTLDMLLVGGSDVNARDSRGQTAMHALAGDHSKCNNNNRLEGARLLLTRGADTGVLDLGGKKASDLLQPDDIDLRQLLTSVSTK